MREGHNKERGAEPILALREGFSLRIRRLPRINSSESEV